MMSYQLYLHQHPQSFVMSSSATSAQIWDMPAMSAHGGTKGEKHIHISII